jgi:hypothetical protein
MPSPMQFELLRARVNQVYIPRAGVTKTYTQKLHPTRLSKIWILERELVQGELNGTQKSQPAE